MSTVPGTTEEDILWEDAFKNWFHGIGKEDGRTEWCVWWRKAELDSGDKYGTPWQTMIHVITKRGQFLGLLGGAGHHLASPHHSMLGWCHHLTRKHDGCVQDAWGAVEISGTEGREVCNCLDLLWVLPEI